ncbi:MAG: PAS domain S-box protein, partial [Thermodesulfovibrionales bacterium]
TDLSLLHMFSDVISSALERRRLDEALNESEEKARSITESAMDAIIMTDNYGKIIYWNPAAEEIFGYTAQEVTGREVHSFLAPREYYAAFKKAYDCFKATGKGSAIGKTFEFSALKKDGAEIQIEISLSAFRLKGLWHASAIIRDITDRRAVEESLLEEKRFAESLIENSAVATFVLDRRHKTVFWNKACEELTGIAAADVTGTSDHWKPFYDNRRPTVADIILDGNIDSMPSLYSKCSISALRPDGIQAEGWYERLNNKKRYILFEAAPIYNSRGELIFAIETLQDITWRKEAEEELEQYRSQLEKLVVDRTSELLRVNMELERDIRNRKQAEEALRLSESRFEEAQRVARIGTWEWNILTGDVYWSNEVYRIFGLTPHGIVPSRWSFLNYVHPDDREVVKQAVAAALEENRQYSIDIRIVRPDGTMAIVHSQGKTYQDKAGKPVMMLGNVQDITERKKMEEEILKIHKLESIGILAGGIAHDFNNLLSAVLGNISVARRYVKPGPLSERLEEAGKAASRAIKLSTQLLTYSKGGVPVKKPTSVASLVKEAIDFTLRGSNIKAEVLLPDNLWLVEADEDQIFQVINNIAINAKQAMP